MKTTHARGHHLNCSGGQAVLLIVLLTFLSFIFLSVPTAPTRHPEGEETGSIERSNSSDVFDPRREAPQVPTAQVYKKFPLSFVAHEGRRPSEVIYQARGLGYGLTLTPSEARLVLISTAPSEGPMRNGPVSPSASSLENGSNGPRRSELRIQLLDADPNPRTAVLEPLPGKVNYFLGNDPKQWRTNLPSYGRVRYENIYSGVDLVYYGNQGQLEYDFVVRPGADPARIRLAIDGAENIEIDEEGDLMLTVRGGQVRLHAPTVYQDMESTRQYVQGRYIIEGRDQITFGIASYDTTKPLVVDPILSYSTFLGGLGTDSGNSVAVDGGGFVYVTGITGGSDFPLFNPLDDTINLSDAFVTRYNPTGTQQVYSTFLGGDRSDAGFAITVDTSGNAYLAGLTESTDFPTASILQTVYGGGSTDAFVTKLDPSGSVLAYSTYLGGSDSESARTFVESLIRESRLGIAIDSMGSAFVTGETQSTDFPTANAVQPVFGGGDRDVFVSKINAAGSGLDFSTFLGGSGDDSGRAITLDPLGGGRCDRRNPVGGLSNGQSTAAHKTRLSGQLRDKVQRGRFRADLFHVPGR